MAALVEKGDIEARVCCYVVLFSVLRGVLINA